MNECEPSPVSEQIEHTKTECLYAKLCKREVNPRQFISGSYQSCDSTHSRSNSEHTSQTAKELLEEGKVSKKNNPNFCFMFHPFFGAKNGWSPRNSRAAVPFIQKVTQTCARQLGLYKLLSLIKQKCLLYLHSPQTNLACGCL